ncbi:MAG: peptidylprolyl isomerase [Sphingobium sp.]|nr:peptidylprolyl isomerase [Sphingobium sp.]MBP6111203.1 peptidylprolyl isomerase [Sphingobium sp.]MBP8670239.1 peptidylprolyl isomerase [Sphingobium sp.]MBP9156177.1 peptidylprolyl isomerase [Sphingobium sp.]MCC6482079.1 peptidylprolyl isomerase [Sphingomonadaceae bacterium]
MVKSKIGALRRVSPAFSTLLAAASFLAFGMSAPLIAQDASDSLKLPEDLTIFQDRDPNLHKPTAVVNGQIITKTDVDQRLALIVLANGGKMADDELARLRLQVLRNLIDETLQIQEASANDIRVDKAELEQSFARVAANFRQAPKDFVKYLSSKGSSAASISRQIEAETAWSRLLRRKVQPFVNVSQEEVKSVIDKLNASKGADEYRVGEIYLSATPENADQIFANGRNIIEQIKQGGSFAAYARQFSEASTAAVGGDLGWIRAGQMPEELNKAMLEIQVGQIAGPVAIPGGYSILYLMDKRKVLTADPRDAMLSLKQISLAFPQGMSEAQANSVVKNFGEQMKALQGCGSVADIAAKLKAEVIDNDNVRIRDLPAALQPMMLDLQVGQATPPFGSRESGVRSLVICGRDDPQDAGAPSFDQIMSQIEDERVNKRARIYLRDLRRDAIIDYN